MRRISAFFLFLAASLASGCAHRNADPHSGAAIEYPEDHMRVVLETLAKNLEEIGTRFTVSPVVLVNLPEEIVADTRQAFRNSGVDIRSLNGRAKRNREGTAIQIVRRSEFEKDGTETFYECSFTQWRAGVPVRDIWSFAVRIRDSISGGPTGTFAGLHAHYE